MADFFAVDPEVGEKKPETKKPEAAQPVRADPTPKVRLSPSEVVSKAAAKVSIKQHENWKEHRFL